MLTTWISFIDWCDRTGDTQVLRSKQTAREAFQNYVWHLRDRVQRNELSSSTATSYQNSVLEFLGEFLSVDNLGEGINLIRRKNTDAEPTLLPDDHVQGRVLSLCRCLFDGLSELVVKARQYPFRVDVPEYLGWENNHLWVFPTIRWTMSPEKFSKRQNLANPYWAYDFIEGSISQIEDIENNYSNQNAANLAIKKAQKQILDANNNKRHYQRLKAAILAHNAFVLQFLANTAMNWSQVRDLQWRESYEVGSINQGFRAIKYRANNKTVIFNIRSTFLPVFKRYLELRKYILDGNEFDYLFVSLGANRKSTAKKMYGHVISSLYETLVSIDPSITKVMSRGWRAAKGDWLIRHADASMSAQILQNTERTILKNYATGSESRAIKEMGNYFERISDVVNLEDSVKSADAIESSVGKCRDFGNPQSCDGATVYSDCHQAEGCFFCSKFLIHAETRDVRKLASCLFCINETSHLSNSIEHFESIYGPIISRVESLLEYISSLSDKYKEMVEETRRDVEENGNMDPYWERKIDMLTHLGLIRL